MIVGLGVVGVVAPTERQFPIMVGCWGWSSGNRTWVVPGKSSLGWLIVVLAHVTHAFLLSCIPVAQPIWWLVVGFCWFCFGWLLFGVGFLAVLVCMLCCVLVP